MVSAPAEPVVASFPGMNGLLAYTETQTQEFGGIYTNNEAGTQEQMIAPAGSHFPAWSPDGASIAYTKNFSDIYIAAPDGSNPSLVASGSYPAWHPDSERLVYSKDSDIFIADPPVEVNLTNTPGHNEWDPAVSPDGTKIAYMRQPTNSAPFDIWIMDINGGNPHAITNGDTNIFFDAPDWSPDGSQIVYMRFVDNGPDEGTDVWVMSPDGTNQHNITNTPHRFEDAPAWSPDGQRIAFLKNRFDNPSSFAVPAGSPPSDIWTMDPDGENQHNVTNGSGITGYDEPAWQPIPLEAQDLTWGDTNCDTAINERDAFDLIANEAGLSPSQAPPEECPEIGEPTTSEAGDFPWGDWDCSGAANAQDALPVLADLAELPPFGDCPSIGTPVSVSTPLRGGVLATFDVVGEPLHIWTQRSDTIAQWFDLLGGNSTANIPNGPLLSGPGAGGHNAPYSWHFDPTEVTMAELAIEACDATPTYVEENPDQFFQIGYCPWSADLTSLADYR